MDTPAKNSYQCMPSLRMDDLIRMQLKLRALMQCPVSPSGPFNKIKVQQKINSRCSKGKLTVVCFIFNSMEEEKGEREGRKDGGRKGQNEGGRDQTRLRA